MSIADRPAKNTMRWTRCAGHSKFTHRWFASPSSRTSGRPHRGHSAGNRKAGAPLPLGQHRPHDLGDDVARLAHDDGVALADVLARDFVFVVEGGETDRRPADEDGLELCERRRPPGPADAHHDVAQQGRLLLGRELVRGRPSGGLAREAELLALMEVVDLHDRTVDVVAERMPALTHSLAEVVHGVDRVEQLDVVVHRQPELAQPRERVVM
jgi:hypothetical protein